MITIIAGAAAQQVSTVVLSVLGALFFVWLIRACRHDDTIPRQRVRMRTMIQDVVQATPYQLRQALDAMEKVWMGEWHPLRGRSYLRELGWSEELIAVFIPQAMTIESIQPVNQRLARRGCGVRALPEGGLVGVDGDGKLIL